MKKNNFWFFTIVCFFIIGFATNFNIYSRVLLGINGIILLISVIWDFIKLRKGKQK